MANVVCDCGSTFPLDKVKGMDRCPVCGKPWGDCEGSEPEGGHPDWITWYYYGYKCDDGKTACLEESPIDLSQHGDMFFLIKEFKAPFSDRFCNKQVRPCLCKM